MRENTFEKERLYLSPYATLSQNTLGRTRPETPCPLRTDFQRDRDRIIHSKAFRRLKNKTQVFLAPRGDHYRTRLTHTLDVTQIARSIARALFLNEDLAEAISLGHDLGHTPFGHLGESILKEKTNGYFIHSKQSIRVVNFLENDGKGLNLTSEVLDGIENHGTTSTPKTLEGRAVIFADKIAYINHDIDDSIRAGILSAEDLPREAVNALGNSATKRINNMIMGIVEESKNLPKLEMRKDFFLAMQELRSFMFKNVYEINATNNESMKARRLLEYLYDYFLTNPTEMPENYIKMLDSQSQQTVVCDYIASMSDLYAIDKFTKLTIPSRTL